MEQGATVGTTATRPVAAAGSMGTVVRWRYQTAVQVARMLNAVAPQQDPETSDS